MISFERAGAIPKETAPLAVPSEADVVKWIRRTDWTRETRRSRQFFYKDRQADLLGSLRTIGWTDSVLWAKSPSKMEPGFSETTLDLPEMEFAAHPAA